MTANWYNFLSLVHRKWVSACLSVSVSVFPCKICSWLANEMLFLKLHLTRFNCKLGQSVFWGEREVLLQRAFKMKNKYLTLIRKSIRFGYLFLYLPFEMKTNHAVRRGENGNSPFKLNGWQEGARRRRDGKFGCFFNWQLHWMHFVGAILTSAFTFYILLVPLVFLCWFQVVSRVLFE